MIDDLKPYPAMKASGVPWLGDIPLTWEIRRNGRLFSQRTQTGFPDLPILEVSLRTGVRIRDFDASTRKQVMSDRDKYKRACKGDIAYNMMRMWQGAVGVPPVDGLVSPAYVVAQAVPGANTKYYEYLFRTDAYMNEVNKFSRGIVLDRNRLYWEDFKQMPTPFPPAEEQAAIVLFLGYSDRRIRHYIAAKQNLIKLLNEQKQATIHRVVTCGLNPNVRLEPSGVTWLGDVPQHWEVKRLKWVTRLQRGYDLPADQRVPGPFPVVSSGGLIGSHLEARCAGPGVVMGRYGSTDAVFYLEQDYWPHNTSLFVTNFYGNLPKWCYYLLRSITKEDLAGKSAVPGVDRKDLFQIVVPVPPTDEQAEIVRSIEAGSQHLNNAISVAEREVVLLREYRTRLVADVVMGKLDVREAAANLPEEPEDSTLADELEEVVDEEELATDGELDAEKLTEAA